MKTNYLLIINILLYSLVIATKSFAGVDAEIYHKAVRSAKNGSLDFAYMNYRKLQREYPKSKYNEQSIFAQAEYNYLIPKIKKAKLLFKEFVENYSESKGKLFALAFLYKIAESESKEDEMKKLKNDIISFKQVSLVFQESKGVMFYSPLNRKYQASFHIDRIEFFVEGVLFAEIPY